MSTPESVAPHSDDALLEHMARDWENIHYRRPGAVIRPTSIAELSSAARESWLVPRGAGHSVGGRVLTDGGTIVDMRRLTTIHEVSADHVVVDAGARWSEVVRATLAHGCAPPVLTDYLELSVGGTLSAGGIGGASHRYGMQTDNVLELWVVTADGELSTCSPEHNAALFNAVRAGHGEHGSIVRASLRLIPTPHRTRRQLLHYTEVRSFLADQRRLAADGRFDYLEGQAVANDAGDWTYLIEAASFHDTAEPDTAALTADLAHEAVEIEDLDTFDFVNRMAPTEALLRESGQWFHPHPWIDMFLPDPAADHVIEETMGGLTAADLGASGVILIYPFQAGRVSTPRLPLPNAPIVFLFALLRTADPGDPSALQSMLAGNEQLRQRTIDVGGTIYL